MTAIKLWSSYIYSYRYTGDHRIMNNHRIISIEKHHTDSKCVTVQYTNVHWIYIKKKKLCH